MNRVIVLDDEFHHNAFKCDVCTRISTRSMNFTYREEDEYEEKVPGLCRFSEEFIDFIAETRGRYYRTGAFLHKARVLLCWDCGFNMCRMLNTDLEHDRALVFKTEKRGPLSEKTVWHMYPSSSPIKSARNVPKSNKQK